MRVMTFNIQHGRNFLTGVIDLPAMAKEIEKCRADLVGLNEVYGKGVHPAFNGQTAILAELLSCEEHFAPAIHLGAGPYGNGFLSFFPVVGAKTVKVPTVPRNHPGYFEDRSAYNAVVDTPEGRLTVIGCHFGLQPEEQAECVKTVCALADASLYPVVLMGDFNVYPDDPVLAPIRKRLKDTADYAGGSDPTFPSNDPKNKIDYIFVSHDVDVLAVCTPKDVVSDHLPVYADIRIKRPDDPHGT